MRHATVRDVLRVFWQHTKPHKVKALFIILLVTAATTADALQPWILKQLFDLFEKNSPDGVDFQTFLPVFASLVALKCVGWLLWRCMGFLNNRFQPILMMSLEEGAFTHLLGHSYQFFADNFSGSLVKKVGRLSRAYERLADEVTFRFIPVIVVLSGGVIGLFLQKPVLAYIFIIWASVFLYFNYLAARWAVKIDVERSKIDSEVGGGLADAVSNAVTIKLFPAFRYEVDRLKEMMLRFAYAQTRSWDRHEIIFGVQSLLMMGIETVMIYVGINGWMRGWFSVGDLAFMQTYLILVFAKLWEVARSIRHLFDAFADSKEMVEIMMTPHAVRDQRGAEELRMRKGEVMFKSVSFAFSRKPILRNFSLRIAPGEKVALVGPSGAGKSTITKLLFRFYDVQKGKILIDEQDISKVTQESLREHISLVPQDPILFHRTLMENIRYGRRGAMDKEVIEAAKKAHCHEFISNLTYGYDTYVGERGVKLSGGERQRVAIARAILKDAPILVLDEATSSLDSESEALIQDALHELMDNKTVMVIAHRLSTIMQMDRILVIENGALAHAGTHGELLKKAGTYRTLWNIQAGGFVKER